MTQAIERRLLDGHMIAKQRRLIGHAARYGVPAKIGPFTERIAPGAFARTLMDSPDILALVNHNADRMLGRTKSGTLRLTDDAIGLAFEIDLPDTTEGRDILALAERNDIGGMSFGFRVAPGGERWDATRSVRTLTDVDLVEVSVVTHHAAYSGTSVAARSAPGGRSDLARRITLIDLGG